jgi:hypothetical protein
MGWQPGAGDDPGAVSGAGRDPRLAGFAKGGAWDTGQPSAALAAVLEAASGAEWRCPGATRDEMLGMRTTTCMRSCFTTAVTRPPATGSPTPSCLPRSAICSPRARRLAQDRGARGIRPHRGRARDLAGAGAGASTGALLPGTEAAQPDEDRVHSSASF